MISQLYAGYRYRSRIRHIGFSVTREEFEELITSDCYLCGGGPTSVARKGRNVYYYNGLDRIDNSVGYHRNNVAPCCGRCNSIKSHSDLETLKKHLPKMLKGLRKVV